MTWSRIRRTAIWGAVSGLLFLTACSIEPTDTETSDPPSLNEIVAGERPMEMTDAAETFIGGTWAEVTAVRACNDNDSNYSDHLIFPAIAPLCLEALVAQQDGCPKGFYATATFTDAYGSRVDQVTSRILSLEQGEVETIVVPTDSDAATEAKIDKAGCI